MPVLPPVPCGRPCYFKSGSINKASSSNETKKRFWLIVSIREFLASLASNVQYKNIFGNDFQWNQVSCQHLFRSGGGDASPTSPPVSAPGHGINFSHGYQHTFRQGCGAVVKMTQFRLRSSSFMNMALAPARSFWFSWMWLRPRSSLFSWPRLRHILPTK